MKYLFLDVQNSNKFSVESKICLVNEKAINENFEEVSKKEILINPVSDFDETVLKYLPYEKNDFDNAKTFNEVYNELKEDFEQEAQVIIVRNGYNDIKLLKEECTSRSLVPFTFKFYDFNEILTATKRILDESELADMPEPVFYRNGKDNVELMAQITQTICSKLNKSLSELLYMAVNSEGYFQDGFISFRRTKDVLNRENTFNSNLNKNSNYKVFLRLVENVKKDTEEPGILEGKKVSVTTGFEAEYFKEMVNLVVLLKNAGADYVNDMNNCNLFIRYDMFNNSKVRRCPRLEKIEKLKIGGKAIDVISLEELLQKLGTTKEQLFEMPLPEIDYIYGENSRSAKPTKYIKIRKNFGKV